MFVSFTFSFLLEYKTNNTVVCMGEEDYRQKFVSLVDALFKITKEGVTEFFVDYQLGKVSIETKKFRITVERLFDNYEIYLTLFGHNLTLKLNLTHDELMVIVQDSVSADSLFCKLFEEWYSKTIKELLNGGDC